MGHTYTNILLHVVFSTKNRAPLITDGLRPELLAYLGGAVRDLGGTALLVNGTTDHVHGLLRLPSDLTIAECVRKVKANSSGWAHRTSDPAFAWQTGYAAFSVSESRASSVIAYIRTQQQHHQRHSFQDELRALLKKHGIAIDERYAWS